MSVSDFIWMIGCAHIAAYSVCGTGFVVIKAVNKTCSVLKVGGVIVRWYIDTKIKSKPNENIPG